MTENIKTIVFPTDFSTESVTALPMAIDLAEKYGAELHCVYVVEVPHIYSSFDMGAIAVPTADQLRAGAESQMEKFRSEHLASTPHGCRTAVLTGHAATEIVEYANEAAAGMIVMTTHGYSGVKHVILGSTTEDVLRHAECPVLSVRTKG